MVTVVLVIVGVLGVYQSVGGLLGVAWSLGSLCRRPVPVRPDLPMPSAAEFAARRAASRAP